MGFWPDEPVSAGKRLFFSRKKVGKKWPAAHFLWANLARFLAFLSQNRIEHAKWPKKVASCPLLPKKVARNYLRLSYKNSQNLHKSEKKNGQILTRKRPALSQI